MAFVVLTDSQDPFYFEPGEIGVSGPNFVLRDKSKTTHILKTSDVVAILRQDFFETYRANLEELRKLRSGDPTHN